MTSRRPAPLFHLMVLPIILPLNLEGYSGLSLEGTGHGGCPTLGRARPFSQGSPFLGAGPGIQVPSALLAVKVEGRGLRLIFLAWINLSASPRLPEAQTGRGEGTWSSPSPALIYRC